MIELLEFMSDYISIGFIKKPYGIKGQLKIKIFDQYLEDLMRAEVLFLAINSRKIPFFVEAVQIDHQLLIKFEEQDSKEAVKRLAGKEIFLRTVDLIPNKERQILARNLEFAPYIGYLLEDLQLGKIGVIEDVLEYPQQEVATVIYKEKEVLIPLNEHLVVQIDKKAQKILLDLPEGLLELS